MLIAHQSCFEGDNISGLSDTSQKGSARSNLKAKSLAKCLGDCWLNYS